MRVCKTKFETGTALAEAGREKRSVGLVPTMGALHEGHLSLVGRSIAENDVTVVSIFVNPTQFGPAEDLSKYPRQLEDDLRKCDELGVDIVFAPEPGEMYPADFSTYVEETSLSKGLCGASRPRHFRGVTTVVTKLFNIVKPDRAYFGRKDAQQAAVIRRMVRDLDMDIEIVVIPIVREADGLAMSSRNRYLAGRLRAEALVLSKAIARARELFAAGERDSDALCDAVADVISRAPDARIDYVNIVDNVTLEEVDAITGAALLALAVFIGDTRLIDNCVLDPSHSGDTKPCSE